MSGELCRAFITAPFALWLKYRNISEVNQWSRGAVFVAADNHHASPQEKLDRSVQVVQERSIELKLFNGNPSGG